MDKLNSLHKFLLECLEDDDMNAGAKAQLTFANFHVEKAIKEQSVTEPEESDNEI